MCIVSMSMVVVMAVLVRTVVERLCKLQKRYDQRLASSSVGQHLFSMLKGNRDGAQALASRSNDACSAVVSDGQS